MKKRRKPFVFGLFLAMTVFAPLHAQTAAQVSADTKSTTVNPPPTGRAPDEVMKKLSDLVHAGKYAEAQQTVAALLVRYPDDQRLVKAKVLLDKASVTAGAPSGAPSANPPTSNVASPEPGSNLGGMDKVDYNALILLARQAQQTTNLAEQTKLLQKFMDQSSAFLRKHPDQMLLWQFRVVSAIGLNEPMEGYEAGQKLLAMGAADSTDPTVQQLLAQLKNKGWLDQREVERQTKFGWIVGTWTVHSYITSLHKGGGSGPVKDLTIDFSMSNSVVEGYYVSDDGSKLSTIPYLRSTISDKGEIGWERHYGDVWHPITFQISSDKRSISFTDRVSWTFGGKDWSADEAYTLNVSSK